MSKGHRISKEDSVRIGNLIKELREVSQLSQDDVANYVGVNRGTVWEWESGRTPEPLNALSILRSLVATEEDQKRIDELIDSIPALRNEELFEQAKNDLGKQVERLHGKRRLAELSNMSKMQVSVRLGLTRKRKEG